MSNANSQSIAAIPVQVIGPIKITGPTVDGDVMVPLATFETPLWPSVKRGARVTSLSGGIGANIVSDRMTRSVLLQASDIIVASALEPSVRARQSELETVIRGTSRYAELLDINFRVVGNLVYIRIAIETGDASGHNMVTLAADRLIEWIVREYPDFAYVSISGNYCADKKVSAVNSILGRGKYVVTEVTVPRKLCRRYLRSTPEKIVDLNIKKNLIGSNLSGGICTANAHFANILLAVYLATGQDAANIVEGSQGIVHAENRDGDLYFSATLPNIIVGSVGNGKHLEFARKNLSDMGCAENRDPGENARRLAVITAAAVLCGELSLLAAITNPGELMKAHTSLERS